MFVQRIVLKKFNSNIIPKNYFQLLVNATSGNFSKISVKLLIYFHKVKQLNTELGCF